VLVVDDEQALVAEFHAQNIRVFDEIPAAPLLAQ
jgi:hypothetical protein